MKDALEQPSVSSPRALRELFSRFLARRRVLLAALGGLVVVFGALRFSDGADAGTPEASLALALGPQGLVVDEDSVRWLSEGGVLSSRVVVFRALRDGDEAHDIFYAEARPGRDGALLDVSWVCNLTHTASADEGALIDLGWRVAYLSEVGGRVDAVTVIDVGGQPAVLTEDWPLRARLQDRVTNIQETGRSAGIGRVRYRLLAPVEGATLRAEDGMFWVSLGEEVLVLDPGAEAPREGAALVEVTPSTKGMPGTITWVVDTVRNLSFVGPAPIEWLEHTVFGFKDAAERAFYSVVGTDTEAEAADDLGTADLSEEERRLRLELSVTDPELGWPPAPLTTVLARGVPGEGEWNAVVDDPFVNSYPNAPPAFYQSFIRADPERSYTRVYVTMWDPRQVQLHIVSGTREPESATGETGRGMAPRDPETLRFLVGGFNGGFQALHGEFGMMSEGRVYLPPKPWAATVAVYDDGRVAMGSWRGPPEGVRSYEERWATEQIPEDMVAYRQNLTSVVEDGVINPWERWWWGAAPANAEEQTYIDRTGLCLTEEGFLAYFWGKSMGPVALGNAMLASRCVRGMHLDMNSRHTGFEFYDVARVTEGFAALDRDLDEDSEFEGPMPFSDEFVLRAKKGVRRMSQMRFPRYSGRDARDFFYLTLRPTLPGPALPSDQDGSQDDGQDGAGVFTTTGLPHAGWPHAFARTFAGAAEGERSWFVRMDPSRVSAGAGAGEGAILAYLTEAAPLVVPDAPHALYIANGRHGVGAPPEGAVVVLAGSPVSAVPDAGAAIGVDPDGFILYVERQEGDRTSVADRLAQAGARGAVALPEGVRLAFAVDGSMIAPDSYERPVDASRAIALRAQLGARTEVLFPETEPLPYHRWRRLQDARVRYLREAPPTFSRGSEGLRDDVGDAAPGDPADAGAP
ncbi:MAG: hypothetical protein DRJ42_27025 [Deltaproteobacteria bacterium]|nr:MAG: hypothetical protein DRJ42_27025 [Deltaproteobacteria bacterium]